MTEVGEEAGGGVGVEVIEMVMVEGGRGDEGSSDGL